MMKGKKQKSDLGIVPVANNPKSPKQYSPKKKLSANSEISIEMKQTDSIFNLDQEGKSESLWLFPGIDGRYEMQFITKDISTPVTRVTEDNREFDDILNDFSAIERKNSSTKPPCVPKPKSHSYVSNIATIVMNSNVIGPPKLDQGLLRQASNLNKLHFPHEVFRLTPSEQ